MEEFTPNAENRVFVGFDISGRTITVYAICGKQEWPKEEKINNNSRVVNEYLQRRFPLPQYTTIVIAAGKDSYWLSESMKNLGYDCLEVQARRLKLVNDSTNNALEAAKLARFAQHDNGLPYPVESSDDEESPMRKLQEARDKLVQLRIEGMNSIREILRSVGMDDRNFPMSNAMNAIQSLPPHLEELGKLFKTLEIFNQSIYKIDMHMEKMSKK